MGSVRRLTRDSFTGKGMLMNLGDLLKIALVPLLAAGSLCHAQSLAYETSLSNAVATATFEGKMVLADFGRPDCVECVITKDTWETPAVRGWLQSGVVIWDSNMYLSEEWRTYATGLSSIALPFVVWLDSGKPETRIHFRTGLVGPTSFTRDLTNQVFKYLPLMVLNHPGSALDTNIFQVEGFATTTALAVGSVTNVPIANVLWRLETPGRQPAAFQPVSTLTALSPQTSTWAQEVSLRSGSNTFASYVQYTDGRTSWTNRIPLIYNGPSVGPADPPAINLASGSQGKLQLTVHAAAGQQVVVEASSNLIVWQPIATNVFTTEPWIFEDPVASASPQARFYRALTPE